MYVRGVPVRHLFSDRRGAGTLLLWAIFILNLLEIFFVQSWLTVLAHAAGLPIETAVTIGTAPQVGGVVAALLVGLLIDRFGPLLGSWHALWSWYHFFVVAIGQVGSLVPALMILSFGAGFCVIGGQTSAIALSAISDGHAFTGVGWSMGIGRIGAIVGPLLGGILISMAWSNAALFLVGGAALGCATLVVLLMECRYGTSGLPQRPPQEILASL
jgi:AAHS family 4-hydroxybenzoate transporter-like MFS transporter